MHDSPSCRLVRLASRALPALVLALVGADAKATPREAILAGDMKAVISEIVALYEEHGLSWADWNEWKIGPYTTTYWYYHPFEDEIVVGDMPKTEEVENYWTTWSRVLTDGQWKPDAFFTNPREALELARFNQWLLATHESAHAITYRYDFNHNERHDYEINCREYHADRLTAAILQHLSGQDEAMRRWRARYLELVVDMGASIPPEYAVAHADYAELEADCEVIDIDQPTPDRMQAYASAFFTRHEALLSARLPALDAVFEEHLKARARDRMQTYETAPEWLAGTITTITAIPAAIDGVLNSARILSGSTAKRAAGFAPDGTVHVAEADHDAETGALTLVFGTAQGELETVADAMDWPRRSPRIQLRSIAVFGSDQFVATFEEREHRTSAVRFRREGGEWTAKFLADETVAAESKAFRLGRDRLFVAYTNVEIEGSEDRDRSWQVIETDLETGSKLSRIEIPIISRHPLGVDAAGRLYFSGGKLLVRGEPETKLTRIFGNALEGNRDGDAAIGEISDIELVQTEPDGDLLILDGVAGDPDRQLVRRIEAVR